MISRPDIINVLASLDNYSGAFMPQYYRFITGVTVAHHNICVANTSRDILYKNLIVTRVVYFNLFNLNV